MKELHKQGLCSEHQEELSVTEYQEVLQSLEKLPSSRYKHTMRGCHHPCQQLGWSLFSCKVASGDLKR
jgi:hypothetical protein